MKEYTIKVGDVFTKEKADKLIEYLKEIKEDIIFSWNEIEEVMQNIDYLQDCPIEEKDSILNASKKRLQLAMEILGEHFTDEENMQE